MTVHERRKIEDINWSMNNRTSEIVSQFSFLGVLLYEHLSWKEHANMSINRGKYVFSKINTNLFIQISVYSSFKQWIIGLEDKWENVNDYHKQSLYSTHMNIIKCLHKLSHYMCCHHILNHINHF